MASRPPLPSTCGRLSRPSAPRRARADTLLIVLFGHGTFDGVDAKFNLVGPDLTSHEWREALAGMPGRLVFVQTASASFPFLAALAAPNRVVMTATDSPAQKYDTVFGEHFVAAFTPEAAEADLDKDGRISMWEAFAYAADASKRYYQQRGQLSVERAMLDDSGDGVGRDVAKQGDDGLLASRLFLDPDPATASGDPSVTLLIGRRNTLETELDELRRKKGFMPEDDYAPRARTGHRRHRADLPRHPSPDQELRNWGHDLSDRMAARRRRGSRVR